MSSKHCSVLYVDHLIGYQFGPGVAHSSKLEWQLEMLYILMRNGFEQIYIPFFKDCSSDFQNECGWIIDNSPSFKKIIIPVDISKEWDTVSELLSPFRQRSYDNGIFGNRSGRYYNRLHNFITYILVGNRLKTHVIDHKNFGPNAAITDLASINHNMEKWGRRDNNVKFLINEIEGMIQRYDNSSLLKFTSKHNITETDIREIFSLPEYKSATSELKKAGLPGQGVLRLGKANAALKSIAESKLTQNVLHLGKATTRVFVPASSSGVTVIESILKFFREDSKVKFIPLHIDVEDFEKENKIELSG